MSTMILNNLKKMRVREVKCTWKKFVVEHGGLKLLACSGPAAVSKVFRHQFLLFDSLRDPELLFLHKMDARMMKQFYQASTTRVSHKCDKCHLPFQSIIFWILQFQVTVTLQQVCVMTQKGSRQWMVRVLSVCGFWVGLRLQWGVWGHSLS